MRGREADALEPVEARDVADQRRQIAFLAVRHRSAVGIDVLAEQLDFADALGDQLQRPRPRPARSAGSFPRRACRARRRSVQYLLQPSMIETKAVAPSARGSGSRSNFSISGNETSTCGARVRRSAAIISGRRWMVCGPNTRSTKRARSRMPSPSWLATQPPTPITRPGLRSLMLAEPAELREHLLLRLLAHGAGVQQHDVGLLRIVGQLEAIGSAQDVGHAGRVVLVHLAAESRDIKAAAHVR